MNNEFWIVDYVAGACRLPAVRQAMTSSDYFNSSNTTQTRND
jgi:hypothetical protein